jgi:hypothetical protein
MDAENLSINQSDGSLIGELEIRLGQLQFAGKGQQAWLAEQLRTVVAAIPTASIDDRDTAIDKADAAGARDQAKYTASLASHIRAKGAEGNQTQRFLAAADWLRLRGMDPLTTAAVSKALTDNHQSRLANPADCLNKNVAKGFCEKVSGGFYITPEGLRHLGHP